MSNKKIYFASDFHLGLPTKVAPEIRERIIIEWLHYIYPTTEALYLLGDIFDFWWEYKRVVPKGYVRFLAELAHFTDSGIAVHLFTGNHDVWMFDYLEKEIGVTVHHNNTITKFYDQTFFLSHGDGLGKTTLPFRIMRAAFHSPFLQQMFARFVHPNTALRFGNAWSHHNRYTKQLQHDFRGDNEPITQFAIQHYNATQIPFYIMGHLHIATIHPLTPSGAIVLLGDWITQNTYVTLDAEQITLLQFVSVEAPAKELAYWKLNK